jgi:hypothetical protein
MFGFLRRRERPNLERDLARAAMRQADRALEERAAGLRKAMREFGIGVDTATLDLIDTLASGFDSSIEQMANDLNGGRKR